MTQQPKNLYILFRVLFIDQSPNPSIHNETALPIIQHIALPEKTSHFNIGWKVPPYKIVSGKSERICYSKSAASNATNNQTTTPIKHINNMPYL